MVTDLLSRITIEAEKCGGKPCVRGTQMRVIDLLELLAGDASFEEILDHYPCLEREDILAAIAYAGQTPLFYLVFAGTPRADARTSPGAESGYIGCWVERENSTEAVAIARSLIDGEGWDVGEPEEVGLVDDVSVSAEKRRYAAQARIDKEVLVFYVVWTRGGVAS